MYVKYTLDTGEVLFYDKKTKDTFITNGNQEANLLQSEKNRPVAFWGFSIYELEKKIKNKKLIKRIDWILCYLTIPIFIIAILLSIFEIKKILIQSMEIQLGKMFLFILSGVFIFAVSLLLHEFGHVVIAISRGAYVPEVGIGIRNKKFLAYTKILQMDKLKSKKDVICIHLGGILINVFIASIALIINATIMKHTLVVLIAGVNIFIALFNCSIYYNSDGADVLKSLISSDVANTKLSRARYMVIFSAILLNILLPMVVILYSLGGA